MRALYVSLSVGFALALSCTLDFQQYRGGDTASILSTSAVGGAGGTTGANAGGIGGTFAVGGSGQGGLACGDNIAPPGGACPDYCAQPCDNNVCVIDCSEGTCGGETVTCPGGLECEINCSGARACDSTLIVCPVTHRCEVLCEGNRACNQMNLQCGIRGTCDLTCGDDIACLQTRMICGDNGCTAACPAGGDAPNVDCGDACSCTEC